MKTKLKIKTSQDRQIGEELTSKLLWIIQSLVSDDITNNVTRFVIDNKECLSTKKKCDETCDEIMQYVNSVRSDLENKINNQFEDTPEITKTLMQMYDKNYFETYKKSLNKQIAAFKKKAK